MKKKESGFSLIEIMIVIVVLPVVILICTQALINVLSAQRKIDAETRSRQNVEYIFNYIQRKVSNAQSISCPDSSTLLIENDTNSFSQFVCTAPAEYNGRVDYYEDINGDDFPINQPTISVNKCAFECIDPPVGSNAQPGVVVTIGVNSVLESNTERGQLELTSKFYTRSY